MCFKKNYIPDNSIDQKQRCVALLLDFNPEEKSEIHKKKTVINELKPLHSLSISKVFGQILNYSDET